MPFKSIIDQSLPFASEGSSDATRLEPDFADDFHAWKGNDTPVTRGALLKRVSPVIDRAVVSYAGADASPSVRSRAKLMTLQAFKTYDPARGTMRTHLLSQLQGLRRTAAQSNQIISVPERVALDRQHLREAEEELRDKFGREPSDMEVANYTGLSMRRLGYVRQAAPGTNTGSILDEEGDVYSPASNVPGAHSQDDAWADMVYYDLGDTDRTIMEYTLGLRGAPVLSNVDLAAKLGVSPGAVSQRKAKIQAMLDARSEMDPFGGRNA